MDVQVRRIALFTGNYNHIADGVSLTLNRLVAYLESRGIEVLVFGPSVENPPVKHNGRLSPVPSISAPGRPEYRVSLFLPLHQRQELLDFEPDLIHIATPDILGLQALLIARSYQIPVVSSFHTNFASYLKYYGFGFLESLLWRYLGWFYSNCETLFVPTHSMQKQIEANRIKTDFRIWSRGVEINRFHPANRNMLWRRKHGISDDQTVILFVSRLVWEKNLRAVIEVFKKYQQAEQKVVTLIAGDGPAMQQLQKELPETVFIGQVQGDELTFAYASSDIFFFPSDTETFGNVTLEAMASGLPVVAANAGGNRSLVEHNVNGFLANSTDYPQFYKYISLLTEDSNLRNNMAVDSRKKAESFHWPVIFEKLIGDYEEVKNKNYALIKS